MAHRDVQPVDKRGALIALIGIVLAGLLETLWYSAPGVLKQPLWDQSAVTLALVLGLLSFLIPVLLAWLICSKDDR